MQSKDMGVTETGKKFPSVRAEETEPPETELVEDDPDAGDDD